MIMIREEHLVPSIGEKIHGDGHSTHDFISIRQYCFTANMVSWTEKQNVFRSSLCHFPIPKECTIFWKYPISESAPVSRNINLWWQLQLKILRWMLHFFKKRAQYQKTITNFIFRYIWRHTPIWCHIFLEHSLIVSRT